MAISEASGALSVKSILYLTDFSEPSKSALPWAMIIARNYGAIILALHVLVSGDHDCTNPELRAALARADEQIAQAQMAQLEAKLSGMKHQIIMERGADIWPIAERAIRDHGVDLLVLGTHGRTGPLKLRLGSVAEEIFRRSPVPVLTIGPEVYIGVHNDARFRRVLFATDFEAESDAAAPVAVAIAQDNRAQLMLLHVLHEPRWAGSRVGPSVAEIMHELYAMIPKTAELWGRSEAAVKYGEPAKQIVQTAKERCADLIVLGVRDHTDNREQATHSERATAHRVLVHAQCPVLTVRGVRRGSATRAPVMEGISTCELIPRSYKAGVDSITENRIGDDLWKMLISNQRIH
jgi:nucleotide-binding universal stress UspA family protein